MGSKWAVLLVGVSLPLVGCGTEGGRTTVVEPAPTIVRSLDLTIDIAPLAVADAPVATFPPVGGAAPVVRTALTRAARSLAPKPVVPLPTEDVAAPVAPAAVTGTGDGAGTGGGGGENPLGTSAEPIGFLDAPSVGISTFVVENGWSKKQLDRGGAGSGGAAIGSDGNIVLFGHRTSHGGVFRHINELEIGADVNVTLPNGPTRRYTVVEKFLDLPDAVHWADAANTVDGRSTVTLISCAHADGSPGGTNRRWFVRAVAA